MLSGLNLTGNDFLDTDQTASIYGQVRDDRDGDGNFEDIDSGPDGSELLGQSLGLLQGLDALVEEVADAASVAG